MFVQIKTTNNFIFSDHGHISNKKMDDTKHGRLTKDKYGFFGGKSAK